MQPFQEVHIIGGGIAGYAASLAFAELSPQIHLWEKERKPFLYSSSRNSGMARSYESDPALSILMKKSLLRMYETRSKYQPFIEPVGLIIKPLEYDYAGEAFCRENNEFHRFQSKESGITLPDGSVFTGRLVSGNGFLNLPNIFSYFEEETNRTCLQKHFFKKIQSIEHSQQKIRRIYFSNSDSSRFEKIEFNDRSLLVNAAGSWASEIVEQNGMQTPPLRSYKRNMFLLDNPENWFADSPIVWDETQEFYIRRFQSDLLVSHCDDIESNPSDYKKETRQLEKFMNVLSHKFSFLSGCKVKDHWSCLRTFATDHRPVIGFDPAIQNLFWVAGLGGRGMSMSFKLIDMIHKVVSQSRNDSEDEIKNPFTAFRFI